MTVSLGRTEEMQIQVLDSSGSDYNPCEKLNINQINLPKNTLNILPFYTQIRTNTHGYSV